MCIQHNNIIHGSRRVRTAPSQRLFFFDRPENARFFKKYIISRTDNNTCRATLCQNHAFLFSRPDNRQFSFLFRYIAGRRVVCSRRVRDESVFFSLFIGNHPIDSTTFALLVLRVVYALQIATSKLEYSASTQNDMFTCVYFYEFYPLPLLFIITDA